MLLGAAIPGDAWHGPASAILQRVALGEYRSTHTSDYVIAECLNFVQARRGPGKTALGLHAILFGSPGRPALVNTIHKVHGGRFASALGRYVEDFGDRLSFTDWTTLVIVEEQGIDAIATFDRGFRGRVAVIDR